MCRYKLIYCILFILIILDVIPDNVESIYEGFVASDGVYPFMVYILYKEQFQCAGGIISKIHVMTSAQCVVDSSLLKDYAVISGTIFTTRKRGIRSTVKHVWRSGTYFKIGLLAHNDIAIVTVNTNFDEKFTPLKIPPAGKLPKIGKVSHLTGWGACSEKSMTYNSKLKYLHVTLNDQDSCKEQARRWYYLGPEHLCIKHGRPNGRSGASRGDIGSILSYMGFMIGIVTHPTADIDSERPDIYTKPGMFQHFYQGILKEEEKFEKIDRSLKICHPSIPSEDTTSIKQQLRETSCGNSYTCARVHSHAMRDLSEPDESQSNPSMGQDLNQPGTSKDVDVPQSGSKSISSTKIYEVSPKKFCVAAENVQANSVQYYEIKPLSYEIVAQENKIQPGDVAEMKCRKNTDDEKAFFNFLLFGSSESFSQHQKSKAEPEVTASTSGIQQDPDTRFSEIQQELLKEHKETQESAQDYSETQQNPGNEPLQRSQSPSLLDQSSDSSSGSESDLLYYHPRLLPPKPDFTPPGLN